MRFVGVDVSKKELVVCEDQRCFAVPNTKAGIARLLKGLSGEASIAMESTASLHLPLADAAHAAGLVVYVLNPKDVKRYRDAVAARGKTDPLDAEVIARMLAKEHAHLRPYKPAPEELRQLRSLILRRSRLVSSKGRIRQSLSGCKELLGEMRAIVARLDKAIEHIDQLIAALLAGSDAHRRLQGIPGIGKLSGAGLIALLERGTFPSADAFVAFVGLDLVANDSGQKRGRRRLSKLGDSETRRLLFIAAMSACRTDTWRPLYESYRTRLSRIQALVALSRKLARTAWSIFSHGTHFQKERLGLDMKP